ncbi:MAG: phosphoglycerate dehydrogenase [Elusimicrobiota bacterium]
MAIKVLVSDKIDKDGLKQLFENSNYKVDYLPGMKPEELSSKIAEYEVLLVRSETKVTADILAAAKKLKFIGRAGAGVDNVDLIAATKHGVVVANCPGGNTIAACEHTFALLLALSRNIPSAVESLKQGKWERNKFVGHELYGKTLSVFGLGKIGKEVALRALAFGMKVVGYDPLVTEEYAKRAGVILAEFEDAVKQADFVTLHLPLNDKTKGMFNKKTFDLMKSGVCIINCSRGGVINENDIVDALNSGKLAGAALDVFSKEPLPADNVLYKTTRGLILTPHLGASTEEAQEKVAQEIAAVVIDMFDNNLVRNTVNLPALEPREELEPYLELVKRMGKFVGGIIDGAVKEVSIEYRGGISKYNLAPISLGFLQGMLTTITDSEDINLVNAGVLAKERGIKVVETKTSEVEDYANLVVVNVISEKDKVELSGTLFSKKSLRFVQIHKLAIDISPEGYLLYLKNQDVPGMVGKIGTVLGEYKINIAGMDVGRQDLGGEAVTIVNVDSEVPEEVLVKLKSIKGILQAKVVKI